jgi:hypothetical protein
MQIPHVNQARLLEMPDAVQTCARLLPLSFFIVLLGTLPDEAVYRLAKLFNHSFDAAR